MMDELGKELRLAGKISETITDIGLQEIGGPILDPGKQAHKLTISWEPARYMLQDICMNCGRARPVKIEKRWEPTAPQTIDQQQLPPGFAAQLKKMGYGMGGPATGRGS